MTIQSTQGIEVLWDLESALGTPAGSAFNIRTAGNPTFPTINKQVVDPDVRGYSHFADQDKPVQFEGLQENAITVPLHIRRASAGAAPPIAVAAEAAGMAVVTESDNTAKDGGAHGVSSTELTNAVSGNGIGTAFLCYDSTGDKWWPSYAVNISTKTLTWMFDLPNAQGNEDGVLRMYSITPRADQVTVTKTLTQYLRTRATHTTAADDDLEYVAGGCACGNFGSLELKLFECPVISPTFHVCDLAKAQTAIANESFRDTEDKLVWGGPNCLCAMGDANGTTGGIAIDNPLKVISASFNFGVTTVPVPGTGGVNGTQAFMSVFNPKDAVLSLELAMPGEYSEATNKWESYFDDWENQDNADKAIQIVQGVADTSGASDPDAPCWGLFIPKCHLVSEPVHDPFGDAYHKVTVSYRCKPSGLAAAAFDETNAPYCFAVYTPSA